MVAMVAVCGCAPDWTLVPEDAGGAAVAIGVGVAVAVGGGGPMPPPPPPPHPMRAAHATKTVPARTLRPNIENLHPVKKEEAPRCFTVALQSVSGTSPLNRLRQLTIHRARS